MVKRLASYRIWNPLPSGIHYRGTQRLARLHCLLSLALPGLVALDYEKLVDMAPSSAYFIPP